MTQSPHGGNAAPAGTEFADGYPLGSDADAHRGVGTPSNPTTSTPWGATSTAPGWQQPQVAEQGHGVPLVQGTAAPPQAGFPTGQTTALGSPNSATGYIPTATTAPPSHARNNTASRPVRRGPRRARLQLRHINPWTVLKFSCVLSIALFFVWLIVIGVLYGILDGAGVIHKINDAYTTVQGSNSKAPVTAGVVFGGAAIIGAVNIVLFVALSTVGSVIYNLCADLVGGIEITLSES